MMTLRTCILLLACLMSFPAHAATIHVPGDQPTIQAGINATVDGDTVVVANGTYVGEGNRDLDFLGKAITVRSANGPNSCIINAEGSEASPHRCFVFHRGEDLGSIVQGFTLTGGYMSGTSDTGGGIQCDEGTSPTITGNLITGNFADNYGGGIYCAGNSSPVISGNTISNNLSGGGIIAYGSPTITGNIIRENTTGISCRGDVLVENNLISENLYSGISVGEDASATITGNTITANTTGISSIHATMLVVENNVITDHRPDDENYIGGGLYVFYSAAVVITGNLIRGNTSYGSWGGGGIRLVGGETTSITGNVIEDNACHPFYYWSGGGGINIDTLGTCTVAGNRVSGNWSLYLGGGIHSGDGDPQFFNNLITDNTAMTDGGGVSMFDTDMVCRSNSICGNTAAGAGGGIFNFNQSHLDAGDCIIWGNTPDAYAPASGTWSSFSYSDIEVGAPGDGNLDIDPLFTAGPMGGFYLSQAVAGQPETSPCVDTSDPASEMVTGTTRSDAVQDEGQLDMGYHYPLWFPEPLLLAGPGPAYGNQPLVRLFPAEQDAAPETEFAAYAPPHFGTNVSCGDLDRDAVDELITGAGPGEVFGPHVRGFERDGTPLEGLSFLAYGTNRFGVNVCTGDLDGDRYDEIITGAGPGEVFGPHVRGWNYDNVTVTPISSVNFFAYGTPKWGVNVSAGDIDGDGFDEIVTGAGPGAVYGPHIRGWNVDGGAAAAIPGVSFLAYGTNKYGVNISCGDVDGDGIDEIVTGAGPGAVFGPHVRGWNFDGDAITPLPGFSFFAWETEPLSFGVNVFAGADLNGDGRDEIVAGRGPDPDADTEVKVYTYDGMTVSQWISLESFPGLTHGANVAAGRF